MGKRLSRVLVCIYIIISFASLNTYAKADTKDLFYLDSERSIVFTIEWDTEEPDVELISPDGTFYDIKKEHKNTGIVKGDGYIFYLIKNAKAGQWKVKYDKKSNEEVTVSVDEYDTGLWIKDFKAGKIDGRYMPISFTTEYEGDISFNYRISVIIDKSGGEKVLEEGTARSNDIVERDVDLSRVNSYDGYMLKLYVFFNKNGVDIFDTEYSEPFSYTNPNSEELTGELNVKVIPDAHEVEIEWSDVDYYGADSWMISLFEDDAQSPASFTEVEWDVTAAKMEYNKDCKNVRIELRKMENSLYSKPLSKEITLDNSTRAQVELPDKYIINSPLLPLTYKNADNLLTTVTVNETVNEIILDDSGVKNIHLNDDWNKVVVGYKDENNVSWEYVRTIYVDRTPPVLSFFENYNDVTTGDSDYIFVGSVHDFDSLTVNGDKVNVGPSGDFSYEAQLKRGRNEFTFTAADKAGNQATYTAVIVRSVSDSKGNAKIIGGYLPLAASSGVGLLLIVYAFIFWRKK